MFKVVVSCLPEHWEFVAIQISGVIELEQHTIQPNRQALIGKQFIDIDRSVPIILPQIAEDGFGCSALWFIWLTIVVGRLGEYVD
jgi:hypothetical protein